MAFVRLEAALAGVNRSSNCAAASFGRHEWATSLPAQAPAGLLAYGCGSCVAIYEPAGMRVLGLMAGHTGRVNGVSWVPRPARAHLASSYADETELVSCSSDGTLRIWRISHTDVFLDVPGEVPELHWECTAVLRGHSGSATSLAVHAASDGALFLASTSGDCSLRVWFRAPGSVDVMCLGTVTVRPTGVLEAVALAPLPIAAAASADPAAGGGCDDLSSYGILVAAGGADCRVHLYAVEGSVPAASGSAAAPGAGAGSVSASGSAGAGGVTPVAAGTSVRPLLSLAGPTNWVRCLSFSGIGALLDHFGSDNVVRQHLNAPSSDSSSSASGSHSGSNSGAAADEPLFLCAGSQDCKLRLWKASARDVTAPVAATVSSGPSAGAADANDNDADEGDSDAEEDGAGAEASSVAAGERLKLGAAGSGLEALLAHADPMLAALQRPRTSRMRVGRRTVEIEVSLDALLTGGHDQWVTAAIWHPPVAIPVAAPVGAPGSGGWRFMQPPCVISSSVDKALLLWQPEGSSAAAGAGAGDADDDAPVASDSAASGSSSSSSSSVAACWGGVWRPVVRVGAAGGAVAGFFGVALSPDARLLMCHGYQGSLHSWELHGSLNDGAADAASSAATAAAAGAGSSSSSGSTGGAAPRGVRRLAAPTAFDLAHIKSSAILPRPCVQGHAGAVADIAWERAGRYLLSAGADQTTRAWAPLQVAGAGAPAHPPAIAHHGGSHESSLGARGSGIGDGSGDGRHAGRLPVWAEIGRPQIHGFEMVALALPAHPRLRHRLVSAGDEKVLRMLDAPRLFLRTLAALAPPRLQHAVSAALSAFTTASTSGSVGSDAACSGAGAPSAARGSAAITNAPAAAEAAADAHAMVSSSLPEFGYVPELALTNRAVMADGAGAPIRDRFQADGRDAMPPTKGSGGGGGGEDGGGGGDAFAAALAAAAAGPSAVSAAESRAGAGSASGSDAALAAATLAAAAAAVPISSVPPESLSLSLATNGPADITGSSTDSGAGSAAAPPVDEDVVQWGRWPEGDRLFGHGHEVVALAVNSAGTIVASACKAREEAGASILLWGVASGRLLQRLPAHKLTVVSLAFSPAAAAMEAVHAAEADAPATAAKEDVGGVAGGRGRLFLRHGGLPASLPLPDPLAQSEFLLSASKDRSVAVWGIDAAASSDAAAAAAAGASASSVAAADAAGELCRYSLLTLVRDAHKRIIWSADWAPLPRLPADVAGAGAPTHVFATGARDHAVKLWAISKAQPAPAAGVTADAEAGAHALSLSNALTFPLADSAVTAVAFAPAIRVSGLRLTSAIGAGSGSSGSSGSNSSGLQWHALLAVGQESGAAALWSVSASASASVPGADGSVGSAGGWRWSASPLCRISSLTQHAGAVYRFAWRPPFVAPEEAATADASSALQLQVASASADETIRVYGVRWAH